MKKVKYYVPDVTGDEIHERTIEMNRIKDLRPLVACCVIDTIDLGELEQDDNFYLEAGYDTEDFEVDGDTWILTKTDCRGHYYGIVVNLKDNKKAKQAAEKLLKTWTQYDEEKEIELNQG